MKTIGAKVEDFVYERVNRLGNISDVVRSAVFEYLEKHEDPTDSLVNHRFNHKSNASENDGIEVKVDRLIRDKNYYSKVP